MQMPTARTLSLVAVATGAALVLSGGRRQDRSAPPPPPISPSLKEAAKPARDVSKLSPLKRQMDLCAQRGADWLFRANGPDGRFVNGHLPALRAVLEGDHYLHQAGAAYTLACAARYTGNEAYLARARQAVLTLLLDTAPDPQDPRQRHTTLPSVFVNRLASAAWLVLAISELPAPGPELLQQSEQLCLFIQRQQRPDGSLNYADVGPDGKPGPEDPDGINQYTGPALFALIRSQAHRPAPEKMDVLRKALPFYRAWWKAHPDMDFVPWHSAAYAEAYLQTREQAFADAVFEMNDWLAGLQYAQLDPRHPAWLGGFRTVADGKPAETEPQAGAAVYAEGLVEACRVTRQVGDVPRHHRYDAAVRGCLQFLAALQYTDANTTHFADWYKPVLLGGFHASHQDGTLRTVYTQHAVCAMIGYLTFGAD